MAKCQNCGRELTGLRGVFFIVCKDCEPLWPKILEERKAVGAKDRLDVIIKEYIQGETLKAFGLAYWDTAGSTVSSVMNKAMGAALLGGLGMQMTGKTHRFGIIAATGTHLHIIDLGEVVGEEIRADMIMNRSGQGKEKVFDFCDVILEDSYSKAPNTLCILSPINLKAIFPTSYDPNNKLKGAEIAEVIDPARKVSSRKINPEDMQVDQSPEPTVNDGKPTGQSFIKPAGMVICPVCKTKVLPKQDGTCPGCRSKIVVQDI
jgi:hypothetical protein